MELDVAYDDRDDWLLHQSNGLFTTFEAEQWLPRFSVEYFISARQQLRLSVQYVRIKAREDEFFQEPVQARYRWEIAPLSDVFLVYTRQADLRAALSQDSFGDLFDNAWQEPLANVLVFKLRYRFGS